MLGLSVLRLSASRTSLLFAPNQTRYSCFPQWVRNGRSWRVPVALAKIISTASSLLIIEIAWLCWHPHFVVSSLLTPSAHDAVHKARMLTEPNCF